jgi:hypothetical protein
MATWMMTCLRAPLARRISTRTFRAVCFVMIALKVGLRCQSPAAASNVLPVKLEHHAKNARLESIAVLRTIPKSAWTVISEEQRSVQAVPLRAQSAAPENTAPAWTHVRIVLLAAIEREATIRKQLRPFAILVLLVFTRTHLDKRRASRALPLPHKIKRDKHTATSARLTFSRTRRSCSNASSVLLDKLPWRS